MLAINACPTGISFGHREQARSYVHEVRRDWLLVWLVGYLALFVSACSTLLPEGTGLVDSPWQSYADAEQTFKGIIPYQTSVDDLKRLKLDPLSNPNISILNYSDVLRRFVPSTSINTNELDSGVQECIKALSACSGYEIDHRFIQRKRYGNFLADFLNFKRKVDIVGWRFNAVLLIKDNIVIYKLTGGQPSIHEHEETLNPLGPLQGSGVSGAIGR